jgi:hypothetical protein
MPGPNAPGQGLVDHFGRRRVLYCFFGRKCIVSRSVEVKPTSTPILKVSHYYLKDADYELFVMFLLAMLWTASIFTLLFSRHVGLIAPPPICAPVTDYLLITL